MTLYKNRLALIFLCVIIEQFQDYMFSTYVLSWY